VKVAWRRQRRGGAAAPARPGQPQPRRVRGAWATPTVVVRAPDGSIVDHRPRLAGTARGVPRPTRASQAGSGVGTNGPATTARIARPPGAPGGVLAAPSLGTTRPASGRRPASHPAAKVRKLQPTPVRPVPPPITGRRDRRPGPAGPGERGFLRTAAGHALERLAPADDQARDRRNARLRWLGTRVGSFALAAVLIYAVFPVRTYLNQRSASERKQQQIEVVGRENDRLEQRIAELQDPETVEEIARRDHNMVRPGEESYGIMPAPAPSADDAPDAASTAETDGADRADGAEGADGADAQAD
jgi:cell division protein FtsB